MAPAIRTVVAAADPRTLRALSRLLATEPALMLCGFAQDAPTAAAIAHAVDAQLLLVEPGIDGDWPSKTKRVLLVDGQRVRPGDAHGCVAIEAIAEQLGPLIARLFP